MSREIKFRAWDKSRLRMYADPFVYGSHELGECWLNSSINDALEYLAIMQFTGEKDCEGNEIYESDLFFDNFGVEYLIVQFYNGRWELAYKDGRKWGSLYLYLTTEQQPREILGHLYEHPSLMEKAE